MTIVAYEPPMHGPRPDFVITVRGYPGIDRARIARVLAHLFGSPDEWDGPLPLATVEITGPGED